MITAKDFPQDLVLKVGDTFVIEKTDNGDLTVVNGTSNIEQISGAQKISQGNQEYQAVAAGYAIINLTLTFVCPTPLTTCMVEPPERYWLSIVIQGTETPIPPIDYPYPPADQNPS